MLFVLYVLHLFPGVSANTATSTHVSNITRNLQPPSSQPGLIDVACTNRSLWDIVWDCLLTTFACSWLSVHPNLPPAGSGKRAKILLRVRYMTWAIIAPELVILWAMKQRCGAHMIATKYRGWTPQHGYLLQMGGFTLYDGLNYLGVLSETMLEQYAKRIDFNHPTLSKEAIEDKSKSDALAKALVTSQVIWFIIQVIARFTQGLLITQLEIATIALGVLNLAMYIGWRKKPFNVEMPIPIFLEPIEGTVGRYNESEASSQDGSDDINVEAPSLAHKEFLLWPRNFVRAIITDVQEMGMLKASGGVVSFDRVSPFYALPVALNSGTKMSIVVSTLGLIFGAIHCIAWFFNFPSTPERMIWRISSIVIVAWITTCLVMLVVQLYYVDKIDDGKVDDGSGDLTLVFMLENRPWCKQAMIARVVFFSIVTVSVPAYVLARLALLVEAFITLRHLPPDAYRLVQWPS